MKKTLLIFLAMFIGFAILVILLPKTEIKPIKYAVKADFNNDKVDDFVILKTRLKSSCWYVLISLSEDSVQRYEYKKVLKISKDPNPRGNEIYGIECADRNEDGNLDLIIEERGVGMLWTWAIYGNGDGTFRERRGVEVIN